MRRKLLRMKQLLKMKRKKQKKMNQNKQQEKDQTKTTSEAEVTGRALAVSWCSLRARAVTNTNRLEVCLAYTGMVPVEVELLTGKWAVSPLRLTN